MLSYRSLIITIVVLCTITEALEIRIDPTDLEDLEIEDISGAVDSELVSRYEKFIKHIAEKKRIDENLMNDSEDLFDSLAELAEGGKNTKARVMLTLLTYWRILASLNSKAMVEAAMQVQLFKIMCKQIVKYCPETRAERARYMLDVAWREYGAFGVMGLLRKNGSIRASEMPKEAKRMYSIYKDLLRDDPDLDEESRARYRELSLKVDKAFRSVQMSLG